MAVAHEQSGQRKGGLTVRQRLSQALHHPEVMAVPETGSLQSLAVEVWYRRLVRSSVYEPGRCYTRRSPMRALSWAL